MSSRTLYWGASLLAGAHTDSEFEEESVTRDLLARAINTNRLIAFVGAGASRAKGYPLWPEFVQKIANGLEPEGRPEALRILLAGYNAKSDLSLEDLSLLVLEEIQRAVPAEEFEKLVGTALAPSGEADGSPYAVEDLIDRLHVRRFVTTNYDNLIEDALNAKLGVSIGSQSGTGATNLEAHSLSVGDLKADELVKFAVAAPGYEAGVFHCHGKQDQPEHMILTESDYQRLYLRYDRRHIEYRDAFDLVLAANPILFVGSSVSERDLLRPLRQFVSERRHVGPERPLFALLPRLKATHTIQTRRYLFNRYGIRTLFYPLRKSKEEKGQVCSGKLSRELSKAIQELGDHRSDWWNEWRRKPALRQPPRAQDRTDLLILHEEIHTRQLTDPTETVLVNSLTADKKRKLVVVGPPGAGKGSLGARLVKVQRIKEEFTKCFFATTRFRNEVFSLIEALTTFLESQNAQTPDPALSKSPLERLKAAIDSKDLSALIVIGGVERLLTPVEYSVGTEGTPETHGVGVTPGIREFLDILLGGRAAVVLTTTIVPESLKSNPGPGIMGSRGSDSSGASAPAANHARRARSLVETAGHRSLSQGSSETESTTGSPNLESQSNADCWEIVQSRGLTLEANAPEDLEDISQALGGHANALSVARAQKKFLKSNREWKRWQKDVLARITAIERERRAEELVSSVIEQLVGDPRAIACLERLALFTTPIEPKALAVVTFETERSIKETLRSLVERRLVCSIGSSIRGKERFTAHTLVRSHVLHRLGSHPSTPGEPHRFILPGYSGEAEEMQPTSERAHRMTEKCVDSLLEKLESLEEGALLDEGRSYARAAFGMIRARWQAGGLTALHNITRTEGDWSHYDSYQRRLCRLWNSMRRLDGAWTSWRDTPVTDEKGFLYADEMSWLVNEIGLNAFVQGRLRDAQAVWNAGMDINVAAERKEGGRRWRQSQLNLATVEIERGNFKRAKQRLRRVLKLSEDDHKGGGDVSRAGRARGLLAWLDHLAGEEDGALGGYKRAISDLKTVPVARGVSLFLRLRGDLYRLRGEFKLAEKDLRQSAFTANRSRAFDLVQYARLSEAALALERGEQASVSNIDRVTDFSRRMGIPKLEADAYKVRAEIALVSGDFDRAGHLARRAIALASQHGMSIRVTAALMLLGRIAARSQPEDTARELIEAAINRARDQGYLLQVQLGEGELRSL